MSPKISIVVPLFNEAEVFPQLIARLTRLLDTFQVPTDVVFVDDGSSDDTAKQMEIISLGDSRFTSVFLSRNFGHQSALSAGLRVATGTEAVFIIDGDLQDHQNFWSISISTCNLATTWCMPSGRNVRKGQ